MTTTAQDRKGRVKRKVRLPRVRRGMKRAFVACKQCESVAYYDFVPYSLSNGVACLPCGHGLTTHFANTIRTITEKQFRSKAGVPQ